MAALLYSNPQTRKSTNRAVEVHFVKTTTHCYLEIVKIADEAGCSCLKDSVSVKIGMEEWSEVGEDDKDDDIPMILGVLR